MGKKHNPYDVALYSVLGLILLSALGAIGYAIAVIIVESVNDGAFKVLLPLIISFVVVTVVLTLRFMAIQWEKNQKALND